MFKNISKNNLNLKNMICILIIILSCYIMLVLATFDAFDVSWFQYTNDDNIHNIFGHTGALCADLLFCFFGLVAYVVPCLIFYINWKYIYQDTILNFFDISRKIIGSLLLLFGLCVLSEFYINDLVHCTSGGVIGNILYENFFYACNKIIFNLILLFIIILGIILCIECSWLIVYKQIFILIYRFIIYLFFINKKFYKIFQRKIDTRDILNFRKYFKYIKVYVIFFFKGKKSNSKYLPFFFIANIKNKNNDDLQSKSIYCASWNAFFLKRHFNFLNSKNVIFCKIILKDSHNNLQNLNYYDSNNCQILFSKFNHEISLNIKSSDLCFLEKRNIKNKHSLDIVKKDPLDQSKMFRLNINLLFVPSANFKKSLNAQEIKEKSTLLESKLFDFNLKSKVVNVLFGPVVTRFELDLAPGLKSSRVISLSRDLARALSVPHLRVVDVIPGKPYIGLEIPNKEREIVYLREIVDTEKFRSSCSPLTLCFGKDIIGKPIIADLGNMPHMLIAGTTGSGKSIGINSMIVSILYKSNPEDVRFIMIDPKMLELSVYKGIPHLLKDVITDMKDVIDVLNWCVQEMEHRYRIMSYFGVRNLNNYNKYVQNSYASDNYVNASAVYDFNAILNKKQCAFSDMFTKLPYIVIIIDEFADLIMSVGKKAELLIVRLSQKARACGIHLILATQRPSVDVITGLIKANIPSRIAFTVSSKIDSRTILGQSGAESLLGMGDMLYLASGSSEPIRIHGAFISDQEVSSIVSEWKNAT